MEQTGNRPKIIVVGRACVGKSRFLDACAARGLNVLRSHITRPRRKGEPEDAYHFDTEEQFDAIENKVLVSKLNDGIRRCVDLRDYIDCDILCVDPKNGVEFMQSRPDDLFYIVHIQADESERRKHFAKRFTDETVATSRFAIRNGAEDLMFKEIEAASYQWPDNVLGVISIQNNFDPLMLESAANRLMWHLNAVANVADILSMLPDKNIMGEKHPGDQYEIMDKFVASAPEDVVIPRWNYADIIVADPALFAEFISAMFHLSVVRPHPSFCDSMSYEKGDHDVPLMATFNLSREQLYPHASIKTLTEKITNRKE